MIARTFVSNEIRKTAQLVLVIFDPIGKSKKLFLNIRPTAVPASLILAGFSFILNFQSEDASVIYLLFSTQYEPAQSLPDTKSPINTTLSNASVKLHTRIRSLPTPENASRSLQFLPKVVYRSTFGFQQCQDT